MAAKIGIIMGSISDLNVMEAAKDFLNEQNISFEIEIVSAHRTPVKMIEYAESAKKKGLKVIIAAAGGCSSFTRYDCSIYYSSCYWSSN